LKAFYITLAGKPMGRRQDLNALSDLLTTQDFAAHASQGVNGRWAHNINICLL